VTSSTVDVVIPVYNQLGLVTQCLESLLRAECSTSHRIVVIDDCSTETELCEYLEKMDRLGAIELHRNKRNLGFTSRRNVIR
jgi:glycosyltransferase involved in cell wall biosynthesis